jgi:diguanylate cyclase (GGDEF)-like protein
LADGLIIIPYCAVNLTTVLFCRALFKPYRPPALLMTGLTVLMLVFPLQLLAIALGYPSAAAISNFVLVRVTWWYLVLMTFTLRQEQLPSRRVLQIFFSAITLIFTALWLSYHSSPGDTKNYLYGREVLIANGLIIGALFAMILSAHSRRLLREVQQSSSSLFLAQKTLKIERELKEQAQTQARTDFLTGLFNRRHFVTLAERELMRSTRYQRPLTMMMIDIDHFKLVNDTWGHQTGDLVLQKVSRVIREMLRSLDICGRTGGEEFAAALIETDEIGAMAVAQRLCQAVAAAEIIPEGGGCVQVTISVGLAELHGRAIDFDSLMNEADHALYRAKQAGRNRVLGRTFSS